MSAQKNAQSKGKFYDHIITALITHFASDGHQANAKIGCMIVGSPGFTRENFHNYIKTQSENKQSVFLRDLVGKTILSHCSTGHRHSLKEILSNTTVNQRIIDMACAQET